jgi:hypothetical protein
MSQEVLRFTLTGTRALLMNNVNSADGQTDSSRERKTITAKRMKKTEDDESRLERIDWEAKLYLSADGEKRIVIPQRNLKALIVGGAKKCGRGLGDKAKEAVYFEQAEFDFEYDGPRDLDVLFSTPGYRDRRIVVIPSSKARVPATRPRFPAGWKVEAEVTIDTEICNISDVQDWLRRAQSIGLGDWHYEFGAFEVTF